MTTSFAEMPLGFMPVGRGRLDSRKDVGCEPLLPSHCEAFPFVIARSGATKQSLSCEPGKAHLKYFAEVGMKYAVYALPVS